MTKDRKEKFNPAIGPVAQPRQIFCVLLFLSALSSLYAEEIYWPSSARIPAKLREEWREFDHIRIPTYTICVAGGKIQISYLAQFSIGADDPRWNTTFVIAEQPLVRCGIAGFAKGDFLPAVNAASLQKYIDGLIIKGAKDILSSTGASNVSGVIGDTVIIDGVKPEIIEYTIEKTRRREYFVETAGRIYVFDYEAPVKIFDSRTDDARLVFARVRFL